jgi:hypothetical protein
MSGDVVILFNHIPELEASVERKAAQAVRKALKDVEAGAKARYAGAKSGRTYKRGRGGGGGKVHRASAPGEASAIDSGDLAGSYSEVTMIDSTTGELRVTSDHAAVQELGGRKMAARPALRPALGEVEPSFREAMERIVGGPHAQP